MRWCKTSLICYFFTSLVCAAPASKNFQITGYIDGSYNYLTQSNKFISDQYDRENDLNENGLTLQAAETMISYQPTYGLGGLAEFMLGRDAFSNAPLGMNPDIFHSQQLGFVIPQAYLQYATEVYSFQMGELLALSGIEDLNYPNNSNFSRSILDGYAVAGSHVGVRVKKILNNQWDFVMGIANGWNTIRNPANQSTLELATDYNLNSKVSFTADVQSGENYLTDDDTSGPTGWRTLLDLYGTLTLTDKLSLAGNYDIGTQNKAALPNGSIALAMWQGIAAYINYTINEKWRSSFRTEYFVDPDGYRTGVKQNWREVTLTFGYNPIKNLQIMFETRHDFSSANAFKTKSGHSAGNNQQSFAINGLYQFG